MAMSKKEAKHFLKLEYQSTPDFGANERRRGFLHLNGKKKLFYVLVGGALYQYTKPPPSLYDMDTSTRLEWDKVKAHLAGAFRISDCTSVFQRSANSERPKSGLFRRGSRAGSRRVSSSEPAGPSFALFVGGRELVFDCGSPDDAASWVHELELALEGSDAAVDAQWAVAAAKPSPMSSIAAQDMDPSGGTAGSTVGGGTDWEKARKAAKAAAKADAAEGVAAKGSEHRREGLLTIKLQGGGQKRSYWCVLDEAQLSWFLSKKDQAAPVCTLSLMDCTVDTYDDVIFLQSGRTVYDFVARTAKDAQSWATSFQAAIDYALRVDKQTPLFRYKESKPEMRRVRLMLRGASESDGVAAARGHAGQTPAQLKAILLEAAVHTGVVMAGTQLAQADFYLLRVAGTSHYLVNERQPLWQQPVTELLIDAFVPLFLVATSKFEMRDRGIDLRSLLDSTPEVDTAGERARERDLQKLVGDQLWNTLAANANMVDAEVNMYRFSMAKFRIEQHAKIKDRLPEYTRGEPLPAQLPDKLTCTCALPGGGGTSITTVAVSPQITVSELRVQLYQALKRLEEASEPIDHYLVKAMGLRSYFLSDYLPLIDFDHVRRAVNDGAPRVELALVLFDMRHTLANEPISLVDQALAAQLAWVELSDQLDDGELVNAGGDGAGGVDGGGGSKVTRKLIVQANDETAAGLLADAPAPGDAPLTSLPPGTTGDGVRGRDRFQTSMESEAPAAIQAAADAVLLHAPSFLHIDRREPRMSKPVTTLSDPSRVRIVACRGIPSVCKGPVWVNAALHMGGELLGSGDRDSSRLMVPEMNSSVQASSAVLTWPTDEWLSFDVPVSDVPLGCRISFTVVSEDRGCLGWVSTQLYDHRHRRMQGAMQLRLWPGGPANPIGACVENFADKQPVRLTIELDSFAQAVVFSPPVDSRTQVPDAEEQASTAGADENQPSVENAIADALAAAAAAATAAAVSLNTDGGDDQASNNTNADDSNAPIAIPGLPSSLSPRGGNPSDSSTSPAVDADGAELAPVSGAGMLKQLQHEVEHVLDQDALGEIPEHMKQPLYAFRDRLRDRPLALTKILRCVDWSNRIQLGQVHKMLRLWTPLNPYQALELFDAAFSYPVVREYAVARLASLSTGDLVDYLPQLTQVLKYEPHHDSPLARFLLRRALENKDIVGFQLFWLLKSEVHMPEISQRFLLLIESYLRGCGAVYRKVLVDQIKVLDEFTDIALKLHDQESDKRLTFARARLGEMSFPPRFSIPLFTDYECSGLNVQKCKYMSSKKLPLWLNLTNADPKGDPIIVIYKVGDDLRQDVLTLQMIRLMAKLWTREGLNLRMRPYGVVATGDECGLVEVVLNSNTIAGISREAGGANKVLKSDVITKWLRQHNPTDAEFAEAQHTFALSCAGYCVPDTDHQFLTNRGFLFLHEVEAIMEQNGGDFGDLLVAGYDQDADQIVYERPNYLVANPSAPQTLVQFGGSTDFATNNHHHHQRNQSQRQLRSHSKRPRSCCGGGGGSGDNFSSTHCCHGQSQSTRSSSGSAVDLVTTPEHRMLVRRTRAADGRKRPACPWSIHTAQELLTNDDEAGGALLFPVAAARGVANDTGSATQNPVYQSLGIEHSGQQQSAFLQLCGAWTVWSAHNEQPEASVQFPSRVRTTTARRDLGRYCASRLAILGWTTTSSLSGGDLSEVTDPAVVAALRGNRTGTLVPSWAWDYLNVNEMRDLLVGMAAASSCRARRTGLLLVEVASIAARDELVRAAIHAGWCPSFSKAAAKGANNRWTVEIASVTEMGLGGGDNTSSPGRQSYCCDYQQGGDSVDQVGGSSIGLVKRDCRTWCFNMPSGCVVVRRVNVDECGKIRSASRPVITANCVATYVLGIGDRHNDNIMMTRKGQFFHIDFGHVLGNFKKKLGYEREKAPFVFHHQFEHVLGGKDGEAYKLFVDSACKAYNIVRRNFRLFISLFVMVLSVGLPEIQTKKDIEWLKKTMNIDMTEEEASQHFISKIEEARASKRTLINDYVHILKHG